MDNKVAAMLKASNDAYAKADADIGAGFQGEWPPEGTHDGFCVSFAVDPSTFSYGRVDTKVPCVKVRFHFEVPPNKDDVNYNPERPSLFFWGREMQIVLDTSKLRECTLLTTDDAKRKAIGGAERDLARLRGHLSKLLLRTPQEMVDLSADLADLEDRLGDGRIACIIKVNGYTPEGKTTTYYTEYVTENIND